MKDTYDYIVKKYNIDTSNPRVVEALDITRDDLAELFAELEFKTGAEIGVDRGMYSELLCKTNPDAKIYSIDPWEVYSEYQDIVREADFTRRLEQTQERLKPYNNSEIIRKSSMDALKDFAPGSLDFVYIDGNHDFDYIWGDLNGWSKIVRKGGLVTGDDYKGRRKGTRTPRGRQPLDVDRALDSFVEEHNIKKLFTVRKDNNCSWFFVKE